MIDHIKTFHQLKCKRAKNLVAGYILDCSIKYCTNAAEIQFSNGSLLVFQFSFDETDVQIQFEDNQVHFLLKNKLTFQPGEVKTLSVNFVTNTQVVPELSCKLDENVTLAPDLHFAPQLCVGAVNLANCSDDIFELYPNSQILTLTFSIEQILGIKRDLNSILENQQMDRNIINFNFLKNTAQCISKIGCQGYIKELT